MKNLFNIEGKTVVITGGCGILGQAITEYLLGEGARVAVLDLNESVGAELQKRLSSKGDILFLKTDVLNKEVLEQNRRDILSHFGSIDILLNAAGGNMPGATVAPDKTFLDLDMKAFERVVQLNLFGTVLPTQVFVKDMAKQGKGAIVNFCSESALRPLTRVAGYGAAKAAIANYTKYMAGELAMKFSPEIRVNAIVPGFLITNQNRSLLTNEDGTLTDRGKTVIAHTPAGRFAEPWELFGTIHYLISDASSFVTGVLSVVDGGFDAFSI
ncbi:MAG: SDR family oxidoreductase [Prevotella sp.]|jgi:NAD(P)-dependent dehydrogenase (short-subunit alcohol dehydrogenase family)